MTFKFLVDPLAEPGTDFREVNRRAEAYLRYLESIKGILPPSSFAFAVDPWHWNVEDHRCLHDSWLEYLTIAELYPEDQPKQRSLNIKVRLLGPYHDGFVHLEYLGVKSYDLALPRRSLIWPGAPTIHGDWLDDEVRLSATNDVLHEVVFSDGGRWLIECADIRYSWEEKERQAGSE